MSVETYLAVSRAGESVVVEFDADACELTVRLGSSVVRPAWGSQACDDWLDWMNAQRQGGDVSLPVDDPDWLVDEGYRR